MIPILTSAMLCSMNFSTQEINALNQRCYDEQADRWLRFPLGDLLPIWIQQYHNPNLGMRALDIGAGNGILAQWLKENQFDVTCIDPSPEMVRRCREKGLKAVQSTIQDFDEKEAYSSVFAILSLLHVPKADLPAQIEKIAALLPEGGTFFLALIEGSAEEIYEHETGFPRFFATYQEEEVISLLEKHFELIDFRKSHRAKGDKLSEYLAFVFRRI